MTAAFYTDGDLSDTLRYEGILWTKCTTYSVLQDFDQWRRVERSEGEWR